jgi:hypothetical protein
MLSEKIFNYGIDLLEQNHNRQLPPAIKTIWREYLDENLTDSEFVQSVKHLILHSRFMPTASDLVEYIHGGKESKGIQEWQDIVKVSARTDDASQLPYVTTRARVALQAVGGLTAVALADNRERQRLEKSFLTVYCQCSSKDSKSLPQSAPVPTQETDKAPPEPSPMPEHIKQRIEALKADFGGIKKKTDEPSHQEEVASSRELPESLRKEVEETMARAQNRHAVQEVLTQDLEF